jgi:predicted TIM-barrel fold metal-dependent hydrolase
VPLQDLDWAVKEINRVAELGIHGLEMPLCAPRGRPYYLDIYDPVWDAAQSCGLPIAMHAGTGKSGHTANRAEEMLAMYSAGTDPTNREHAVFAKRTAMAAAGISSSAYQCFETIPHLVAGGVLERFPDLHFVIVETGASWLLYLLDSMDTAWTGLTVQRDVARTFFKADGSPVAQSADDELFRKWPYPMLPSDYVKRQMHVGFMEDFVALRNREYTGIDCLVWGSDYPHYEGTWPNSEAAISAQADKAGLTEEERAAIFGGTIAKLYKMPLPAAV